MWVHMCHSVGVEGKGLLAGAPSRLLCGAGDLTPGIRLCCKPPSLLASAVRTTAVSLLVFAIFIGKKGRYGVRSAITNKLSLFYLGLCCVLEESQSGDSWRPTVFSDDSWQVQREYILSPVTLTRVLHGLILSLILKHKG